MSQITHLNTEEMRALQGMSLEAKTLYVFELRRYADENGITGRARRHSYQSFREQLTVFPDPKSTKKASAITEGKIRAVIVELERHGLIEKLPEPLVFQLVLATRHQSVQNMNDGRATDRATARTTEPTPRAATLSEARTTARTTAPTADEQRTSPVTIKQEHNPPNPPESGGKADDLLAKPEAPAKAVNQGDADLDTLLSAVWTKPEHSREMFAMPVNWTCTTDDLEKYLKLMHVKALVNGKRVTANQLTQDVLADFVRTMHAEGRRQRHEQWVSKLAGWLVTVLANRFKAHGSGLRPEDDPNFDYPLHRSADVPRTQNVIPVEQARSNIARIRSQLNNGVAA